MAFLERAFVYIVDWVRTSVFSLPTLSKSKQLEAIRQLREMKDLLNLRVEYLMVKRSDVCRRIRCTKDKKRRYLLLKHGMAIDKISYNTSEKAIVIEGFIDSISSFNIMTETNMVLVQNLLSQAHVEDTLDTLKESLTDAEDISKTVSENLSLTDQDDEALELELEAFLNDAPVSEAPLTELPPDVPTHALVLEPSRTSHSEVISDTLSSPMIL